MGCTQSFPFLETTSIKANTSVDDCKTLPIQDETGIGEAEKIIIRRQWRVLSADIKETGTAVFLELFKLNPEMKQLFPFRHMNDEDLLDDARFRQHGIRFMQAINAMVENIDDLESSMTDSLLVLGKQHINFMGFKSEYFETFHDAISNVWRKVLGARYSPACAEAWRHIILFIMDTLKRGHYLALIEAQQNVNLH